MFEFYEGIVFSMLAFVPLKIVSSFIRFLNVASTGYKKFGNFINTSSKGFTSMTIYLNLRVLFEAVGFLIESMLDWCEESSIVIYYWFDFGGKTSPSSKSKNQIFLEY